MTVLNVTTRQLGRGLQRAVGDRHMVVVLVTGTQALKDLNGLGNARLMHLDRLETTFESRILLDVLAVLVSGGSANGLQLATGQHGLQHVGSAKSTVC